MRVEDGKLIYDLRPCLICKGTGRVRHSHLCPRYGMNQNGKPCLHCGATTKRSHHCIPDRQDATCGECGGSLQVPEDRYDYLPQDILNAIPIIVVRSDRGITWNESYLGLGCLYSVVDYGEHKRLTDEELVAQVRDKPYGTQTTAVVDDQDRLPPFIAICCHDSGYSVRSAWQLPQLLREWDEETGFMVGMAVYRAGGHGTMAAALGKPVDTNP